MNERIVGEYRPPRELAAVAAPRVSGRGTLDVSSQGLVVEGQILDVPPFPLWKVTVPLAVAALIVFFVVDRPTHILGPMTMVALLLYFWSRFRAEYGSHGRHAIPWHMVEHVVRMPADPDVIGLVLARPLAGDGTPEQVFFAPTQGVEHLVVVIRANGPTALTIDLESAEASAVDAAAD